MTELVVERAGILRRVSLVIFHKLLAIFLTVGLGCVVGRMRWLGSSGESGDPARVLSNAAFYLFVPALLFRTISRQDFGALPWRVLIAYFLPVLLVLLGVYLWERRRNASAALPLAAPSVRAITCSFSNALQIGVPVALAVFGEEGLGIHLTIVSLHALILLTVLTSLVELDLARSETQRDGLATSLSATLRLTVRNTVIHPVVLPVLAGMLWNATGLGLPPVVDDVLQLLGTAVVPLCLTLIGMSLAYYGVRGSARQAGVLSVVKLVLLPAVVLVVARWVFGLDGLPLAVMVMMAAAPIGSNALIFAQRYRALEAETTTATVFSTLAYGVTAPLWLLALRLLGAT